MARLHAGGFALSLHERAVSLPAVGERQIASFLYDEANLLDERRFDEWLALFSDECFIWAPSEHDLPLEARFRQASIYYDERSKLESRVHRLRHPRIHSQLPPSRTSRVVGNVRVVGPAFEGRALRVDSRFVLVESRQELHRTFAGSYEHYLVEDSSRIRIYGKVARVTNCDQPMVGVGVPF